MSETAIAAAPIVSALSPFVNAAASGFVVGIGGLLFAGLARWTGIAFTPDVQAQLEESGRRRSPCADRRSREQR